MSNEEMDQKVEDLVRFYRSLIGKYYAMWFFLYFIGFVTGALLAVGLSH